MTAIATAWSTTTALLADAAALLARITLGHAFILTGLGKLQHLQRTSEFFASLGIPAPQAHAIGIGCLELAGGALLVLGLGVRPVSFLLLMTMIVALITADRADLVAALALRPEKGLTDVVPWMFGLILLTLLAHGGGRVAIDRCWERKKA